MHLMVEIISIKWCAERVSQPSQQCCDRQRRNNAWVEIGWRFKLLADSTAKNAEFGKFWNAVYTCTSSLQRWYQICKENYYGPDFFNDRWTSRPRPMGFRCWFSQEIHNLIMFSLCIHQGPSPCRSQRHFWVYGRALCCFRSVYIARNMYCKHVVIRVGQSIQKRNIPTRNIRHHDFLQSHEASKPSYDVLCDGVQRKAWRRSVADRRKIREIGR